MGLIQLIIILGAAVGSTLFFYRTSQHKRLETSFYQLLRRQNSCISLIQLIAISQVNSQAAKSYLDEQVRLLNGIPEVDEEGNVYYRFPKIRIPAEMIDDDW